MAYTTDVQFRMNDDELQVRHPTQGWLPVRTFLDNANGRLDPLTPNLKPISLTTGGVSVMHSYVTPGSSGGAIIQGGRIEPRFGMTFVGGLTLQGGARYVQETPGWPTCIRGVHDSGDAAAVWCKGDSVMVFDTRMLTMDDIDNHFRVGPYTSTPIQLGTEGSPEAGTLRDPATWNGNFCRYAVTGGYPVGDFSAIRDYTKLPA